MNLEPLPNQLPNQLSSNGIQQLFAPGPHAQNKEFILQLIKLSDDCEESKICFLSDGYVYVKGILKEKAKMKAVRGQLVVFDIIKINWAQLTLFGLEKDPALEINDCDLFGIRMLNTIGSPISYVMFYHNNYINKSGSSKISEGQKVENALSLDEILENFPNIPKKWILKAKIVKKPQSINLQKPFMIVKLMDSNFKSIQGVFFGKEARDYFSLLKYNHQYLFSNGLIKIKKNNPSQFEIKFTQHSQIIPIETMKTTKTTNKLQDQIVVKAIQELQNGQIVNLTAKILRVRVISKGRSLEVMDTNFDMIEVMLWEEFNQEIIEGQTYTFFNVRIKRYHGMISLQSIRHKTQVRISFKKIQKPQSSKPKLQKKSTFKQLINPSSVKSILQVIEMKVEQKMYVDVNGFLIINTYPDSNKFFKIQCKECGSKEASFNPICCRKCSSPGPSIRWNVRGQLVDEKQDIKVILNEEMCQKLFKWYSRQAFVKFNENLQQFMARIQSVSYIEGIYKIKINPFNGSVYYNVLQLYKDDSRILLTKAYQDLKLTLKKFTQNN